MLNAVSILLWTAFLVAGCILGWLFRARRSHVEKAAIGEGWREQLDAQRKEHSRLEVQNRNLMQQVNDLQARVRELSDRNEQQSVALQQSESERQAALKRLERADDTSPAAVPNDESQDRIAKLEDELRKWQQRLPPLIERYRQRDAQATRAEDELAETRDLLERYRAQPSFDETRAGAMTPDDLDGMSDASNDTLASASATVLLQIKGIGPAISGRLAGMGVQNLEQLAALTDEEAAGIAESIRGSASKIADWQAQARELLGSDDAS